MLEAMSKANAANVNRMGTPLVCEQSIYRGTAEPVGVEGERDRPSAARQRTQQVAEHVRIHWLDQMMVEARLPSATPVFLLPIA